MLRPWPLGATLALAALAAACNGSGPHNDAGTDARADATLDGAGDGGADGGDAAADVATDAPTPQPCTRIAHRDPSQQPAPFPGPSAPVDVYRDSMGVPHIFGHNDADVFYAAGYMQAVDRLWEMDMMRRTATGTLAEVVGMEKLSQDQTVRMVDIARWGRESVDRVRTEHPESFALIVAWVGGVNRRIQEVLAGTAPLPAGFRPTELNYMPTAWTPDDALAVSRLILFNNANQLEYDILATILQKYVPAATDLPIFRPVDPTFVMPPDERPASAGGGAPHPLPPRLPLPPGAGERLARFVHDMTPFRSGGSNNWAVAGAHTDNGHPLLESDPHQPLQSPSLFWAHHMNSASAGGNFDVVGFGFVGTPGVQLGHNRDLGWSATTTFPDIMDLWDVPADAGSIQLGTQRLPFQRCIETINVKGASPVQYVVDDVPGHGVLLPNNFAPLPISSPGNRVLFGWTGFHGTPESHVFFSFDQAHNVDEFDHAVDQMELGAFNFVAADATNITYRVHVLVPDRGSPADLPTPNVVLDGTNPRTLWTGNFLDSDHLPHSRGGAQGFIASANNDPYGFTANGSIADDPWYYGVWFDPGTRAGRITSELERLLATGNPITADQFQTLQQDTHSEFADLLLPTLTAAFSSTDPALAGMIHDPELVALRDALAGWDRTMDRSSSAAVVFEGWEHFLARGVLADDLSVAFDPVMAAQPIYMLKLLCFTVNRQFPTADHYMQEGRDTLALRALASTRDWLATRFGGADPSHYRWSDFHRTVFKPWMSNGGPFAVPPATTNGAEGTVNVSEGPFFNAAMTTAPNMFHDSSEGSIYRIVTHFDTTGTPVSVVQFPRGNSADPDSPFFGNTVDDWANGVYHTLLFERADIEGSAGVTHSTINPP